MKVVAFNGSVRKDGRVAMLLRRVLAELEAEGIETELLHLEKDLRTGCYACGQCAQKRDDRCSRPAEDGLRRCVRKMIAADGIIIGSPTYSVGCSPATQRILERVDDKRRMGGKPLAGKVAAAVIDVRGVGAVRAYESIDHWFRNNEVIVIDSSRGGSGMGASLGDAERQEELLESMANLGRAMVTALKERAA